MRVNGDYIKGKELSTIAKGIVTVDYWHYPQPGSSTNSQFGLWGGGPGIEGVDFWNYLNVWKNDQDLWWVSVGSGPSVATYSGSYTHIVITINTDTGSFDLRIDGMQVYNGAVNNANKIDASGIRYVTINSGRGGAGTDSYLDDLIITSLPTSTPTPTPTRTLTVTSPNGGENWEWYKPGTLVTYLLNT